MGRNMSKISQNRLYGDLSWTWPIISPPEDYIEETEYFYNAIREHSQIEVKTLLNLGCGGGHNDFTLKKYLEITSVDISEAMLDMAIRLNPEVTYSFGDMRTVRLGKTFDAVAISDAIDYMLTKEELRAACKTAFHHLKPGGVFLTLVEEIPERFKQTTTTCTTHTHNEVEIAFIENLYDPDPTDTTYEATMVFLIRCGGNLDIEADHHVCGIFSLDTWRNLIRDVGFTVKQLEFKPSNEEKRYPMFVCIKK
jgi:SAM-dependent methyltransferase